jgi:hypothetical protein
MNPEHYLGMFHAKLRVDEGFPDVDVEHALGRCRVEGIGIGV